MDKPKFIRSAEVGDRIKSLIEKSGLNPYALSKKIGVDSGNFYKMLSGQRSWKVEQLWTVAQALGISIEELLGKPISIPIVASISASPFHYPDTDPLGVVKYYGRDKDMEIESLYAIQLCDRSMMPAFQPGTKFIVERDSHQEIRDENLVVCPNEDGTSILCRVYFSGKDQITLRSLNPTIPDRLLPKTHLKLCERVVLIYPV